MYEKVRYEIIHAASGEVIARDSVPTPRLLAEGGGEAYQDGDAKGTGGQPFWRLKDKLTPKGTVTVRVRVNRTTDRLLPRTPRGRLILAELNMHPGDSEYDYLLRDLLAAEDEAAAIAVKVAAK